MNITPDMPTRKPGDIAVLTVGTIPIKPRSVTFVGGDYNQHTNTLEVRLYQMSRKHQLRALHLFSRQPFHRKRHKRMGGK